MDSFNNKNMDKYNDIVTFNKIKEIAEPYKIEITSSSNIKKNQHNECSDNVLMVQKNTSNVSTIGKLSIMKNRVTCQIQDCIENNDIEALQIVMNNLDKEILTKVNMSTYKYKYHQNVVHIMKNSKLEFLKVLEKSTHFQEIINVEKYFWLNVSLELDNNKLLKEKISLEQLLECETIQEKIINYVPINIVNILMDNEKFKHKIEQEFDLIHYIPNYINNNKEDSLLDILLLILKNIKPQYDKLNLKQLFNDFDSNNMLQTKEKNKKNFNNALEVFIINSDYVFTEEDKKLIHITKENKNLMIKKELNNHLNNTLMHKAAIKKLKI